jgi:hypothetical protein
MPFVVIARLKKDIKKAPSKLMDRGGAAKLIKSIDHGQLAVAAEKTDFK